jgi:hypothetical protein
MYRPSQSFGERGARVLHVWIGSSLKSGKGRLQYTYMPQTRHAGERRATVLPVKLGGRTGQVNGASGLDVETQKLLELSDEDWFQYEDFSEDCRPTSHARYR